MIKWGHNIVKVLDPQHLDNVMTSFSTINTRRDKKSGGNLFFAIPEAQKSHIADKNEEKTTKFIN